jgi:hypothetical protein
LAQRGQQTDDLGVDMEQGQHAQQAIALGVLRGRNRRPDIIVI